MPPTIDHKMETRAEYAPSRFFGGCIDPVQFWDSKPTVAKMRTRTKAAEAIRAIVNLAIQSRRRRDAWPSDSGTSIRADEAYRAHLIAAKVAAIHLL